MRLWTIKSDRIWTSSCLMIFIQIVWLKLRKIHMVKGKAGCFCLLNHLISDELKKEHLTRALNVVVSEITKSWQRETMKKSYFDQIWWISARFRLKFLFFIGLFFFWNIWFCLMWTGIRWQIGFFIIFFACWMIIFCIQLFSFIFSLKFSHHCYNIFRCSFVRSTLIEQEDASKKAKVFLWRLYC